METTPLEPGPGERVDPASLAERLFRTIAVLACGLAVAITLGSIVNHFAFDDEILDLNAGLEGSFNSWVTIVVAFSGALAAALHALIVPDRRWWFASLAALFALLSLDDLAQFHERVATNLDDRLDLLPSLITDHIETVIFAPVFGLAFVIVWVLARDASTRASRFLRLGVLLLVAAVIVDLGSTVTRDLSEEWPQATRIAIEEGLEVAGWVLVAGTLVTLACLAMLDAGRPGAGSHPPSG